MRNETLIVRLPEIGSQNYGAQLRTRFEGLEPAIIAGIFLENAGTRCGSQSSGEL
jgi:hypothetical protein